MRLDNYSVAAFETFEPLHVDADAPRHGACGDTSPEPVVAEEAPSQLLAEMARQQPVFVRLPQPGTMRRIPRLDDGDRWALRQREPEGRFERFEPFEQEGGGGGELPGHTPTPVLEAPAPAPEPVAPPPPAPAPVEAAPPAQAPAPVAAPPAAPAQAAAPGATLALPLGPAVDPAWLQQREAALQGVRADFEAARAAARGAPPADVANTAGTGWVPAPTDHDGNPVNGAVFVPDAAAAAAAPEFVPAWMLREGGGQPAPQGQWLAFDDGAYEQAYRERLAARPEASAGLNQLAQLYGQPVQQLLGARPELWALATQDHAINAGAPPQPGVAMGDARTLGQLDLYLADPFITRLRTELGGTPAAPTGGLALEQQRLHGAERYADLTQLSQAMAAVRQTHAAAMQAARDGGGTGWIDVPLQFGTDPETGWPTGVYQTVERGDSSEIVRDANGMPVLATQRVFDEAAFTNAWLDQGGLAQEAFARFYGRAHSQIVLQHDQSESGGPSRWVSQPSLDNPAVGLDGWRGVHDGEFVSLDLNHAPRLNNDGAIGFDPQLGWVTPSGNIYEKRSFLDKALPIVVVAFTAWVTAGATTGMGWVGGAITGAATSTVSGLVNGNLSLKGVLIGAVSGALTASLTPGLTNTLKDAGMGAASGIAARMTVQGGIQALLGGKFKDGAIAGFASGLAELTSANIGDSIKQAVEAGTMTTAEALAARTFNTMLSSAIRAAGSPDDSAHAFAQEWLGALMQEHLPAPVAPPTPDPEGVQTFPVPDPGEVEVRPLPPTAVLFDDDGNLMPGAVDPDASALDQAGQIYEGLLAQGLTQEEAADMAADYLEQQAAAPQLDAAAQAAWAAMTPQQREARMQDVQREIEFQLLSQEINDASIQDPSELAVNTGGGTRGPVRGGLGNGGFEMVRNGDWDAKLNLASDPIGLIGEVANLKNDLAKLQRVQIDRIQTMRQGMAALGVKDLPQDFVLGLDGSRDYQSTVDRLQGAYENHVRDQRLRAAWGDDYANLRIGRSKMTVLEFEKNVLDLQQRATDAAYAEAVAKIASGELKLKSNDFALTAGTYVDTQVRAQLRFMGRAEGLPDSSASILWAVNRRITDGQQIGIPDNRLGTNIFADTSLSRKQPGTEQLQRWNAIRSGSFLIMRPTELGGSYAIPKVQIPDPKAPPRKP